jgi:hypothetical protein
MREWPNFKVIFSKRTEEKNEISTRIVDVPANILLYFIPISL